MAMTFFLFENLPKIASSFLCSMYNYSEEEINTFH